MNPREFHDSRPEPPLPKGDGPRILVFDIETAPMRSFMWRMWKETIGINQIETDWYVLCWCAKWAGERRVFSSALPDFEKRYEADPENDEQVMLQLWDMINAADILVAHNGNRFDIPKVNARFIYHKMPPPSPVKSVDTYQIARSRFGFTSNKLDYIAQHLGLGQKISTGGFELWRDCLAGDPAAWRKMVRYCKRDVRLLENVYLALRPWARTHPVHGLYAEDEEPTCHRCGSHDLSPNGTSATSAGLYKRYRCNSCGAFPKGRHNLLSGKEQRRRRDSLLGNIV